MSTSIYTVLDRGRVMREVYTGMRVMSQKKSGCENKYTVVREVSQKEV